MAKCVCLLFCVCLLCVGVLTSCIFMWPSIFRFSLFGMGSTHSLGIPAKTCHLLRRRCYQRSQQTFIWHTGNLITQYRNKAKKKYKTKIKTKQKINNDEIKIVVFLLFFSTKTARSSRYSRLFHLHLHSERGAYLARKKTVSIAAKKLPRKNGTKNKKKKQN